MSYEDIVYTEERGIATIAINRPSVMNAFRGQTVEVELLPAEPGSSVALDRVLLVSADGNTLVGQPTVPGAAVVATVAREGRGSSRCTRQGQRLAAKPERKNDPRLAGGGDEITARRHRDSR